VVRKILAGIHDRTEEQMSKENSRARTLILTVNVVLFAACIALAQSKSDPLRSGFEHPPRSARPQVWWHWMDGNVTKEGIKLDLEWMHRVGLAGFQNFDAAIVTPQVVEKRLVYMTPEWKDAFRYAVLLGDQLGMEEAIAGSPGWSESGGPWVPGPQAMKKYVWSATRVEGGKPFSGALEHPPSKTGLFQNMAIEDEDSLKYKAPEFYADSVVIAYKAPEGDVPIGDLGPRITCSGGSIDPGLLSDGDLATTIALPKAPVGGSAWVRYEFPRLQTIRGLTIAMGIGDFEGFEPPRGDSGLALEASDDGETYRVVAKIPKEATGPAVVGGRLPLQQTISFVPVTAKFFRVTFKTFPPPKFDFDPGAFGVSASKPATAWPIAELVLHAGARVNRFEVKAAFAPFRDLYSLPTPAVTSDDAVPRSQIIDLTSKLQADGTLDWDPPGGHWMVLRFGYSLLGITNHPATVEATGLEVDKLNHTYVKNYMETYLQSYRQTVGANEIGSRGIQSVVNDSWEAGSQNWTDEMIAQFKKRRGYDPVPWMPVLTGVVVESAEASDKFLWDFRKTIEDLIADEHYGQLEATLHKWGMRHYGESHEEWRAFPADGMEVKKFNEVPMSAMWTQRPGVNNELYGFNADDRESASVAHIYGQNLAAAESLTADGAAWAWSPATLKPTADREFLNGINRFVISESVHQPLVGKAPGMTLGPFGQWFNRNETWAEEAGAWVDYLARSSYLLQQGRFVADVVYFYGEDSNITAIFQDKSPDVPAGYDFDYINPDGLIHVLSAGAGRIRTKSGMEYRLLALDPNSQHMSLPVLRAIRQLVGDGAVVAGSKPTDDPSLADDPAEFRRLSRELFGDGTGVHAVGKGRVYAGQNVETALKVMNVAPDFDYTHPESDTRLLFAHRKLRDGDLYFVDNRNDRDESVDATFRVTGKAAEVWHAETGKSEAASYRIADGRTTVPLHFEPWGAVFVVFRDPAKAASRLLPGIVETDLTTLDGAWTVAFQPGRGAPASISLNRLMSWTESTDAGVKYFSGSAVYSKTVQISPAWFKKGTKLWVDLGDVKNLADVTVNGKPLGIVWHAPYRVDATSVLKPGANQLTIKVINAWVNRLIGDQQPGATTKYTFADVKPYNANSPLLPSGLLGPVRIYSAVTQSPDEK